MTRKRFIMEEKIRELDQTIKNLCKEDVQDTINNLQNELDRLLKRRFELEQEIDLYEEDYLPYEEEELKQINQEIKEISETLDSLYEQLDEIESMP